MKRMVSLRLDGDVMEALKAYCAVNDMSQAEVVQEALLAYMEPDGIQSQALPHKPVAATVAQPRALINGMGKCAVCGGVKKLYRSVCFPCEHKANQSDR